MYTVQGPDVLSPAARCWRWASPDTHTVLHQIPQGYCAFRDHALRPARQLLRESGPPRASAMSGLANLFLPSFQAHGSHQLKFGVDFDRDGFPPGSHAPRLRGTAQRSLDRPLRDLRRQPFRAAGAIFEASQYLQDRWTPRDGLLIEAGLRADWNQIVRECALVAAHLLRLGARNGCATPRSPAATAFSTIR